jgi:hypothetical protein
MTDECGPIMLKHEAWRSLDTAPINREVRVLIFNSSSRKWSSVYAANYRGRGWTTDRDIPVYAMAWLPFIPEDASR